MQESNSLRSGGVTAGTGGTTYDSAWTRLLGAFRPYDVLSVMFLVIVGGLLLAFRRNVERWYAYAVVHLLLAALIVGIVMLAERHRLRILTVFRDVYPFLLLFFLFEEMERLTHLLFPGWKNHLLIAADRFLFGVHPTVWLEGVKSPSLTEVVELAYFSYYVLLPVGGLLLYLFAPRDSFRGTLTAVALAFYLCFLGYVLLPAEGPWRSLAHLRTVDMGGSFFRQIVSVIQRSGGIVGGCFPSAHVSAVCAAVTSFFFFRRSLFYLLLPYTAILAFATVYGWYHYAVDSLAGVAVGFLAGVLAVRMSARWPRSLRSAREG
jgi:membrane-associated phospholipid phosphatase